jgi:hypothetical protein
MKESVHYYAPDISNVQAKIVIEQLKENALITQLSTRNIISRTISKTEVGVVGQFKYNFDVSYNPKSENEK